MGEVMSVAHDNFVLRAERWLKTMGCGVVFRDEFRPFTHSGEQPDAIGWRDGISIMIECKVSRSDFLKDKKKRFRKEPALGMGDWRFMMCPPGIIKVEDLPEGWGLLYVTNKQIKKVHGVPSNCHWWDKKPFEGAKRCEMQMMYSALRRMVIHGHFDDIYKKLLPAVGG